MNEMDVVEWEERPMSELTLSQLQQEAYRVAVARGQWPRGCRATAAVPSVLATVARRALGEEATELGAALSRLGPSGPLDPVADELADVVIVCASIAEALGIDLERAVKRKMAINAERATRERRAKRVGELTPKRLRELVEIAEAEAETRHGRLMLELIDHIDAQADELIKLRRKLVDASNALTWMGTKVTEALHALGTENNPTGALDILYAAYRRYYDELKEQVTDGA